MTHDRTEQLVRDAFAEEAARAADPREVLANVRGRRPRRSYGLVLATAAVVVVVAAVATFVVPKVFQHGSVPAAGERQQSQAVQPTNVLVVGVDEYKNTDSIVLVQINRDGSTSLVSLPRDSWVSAAGTMTKLNQVYQASGMDALAATVRDLTGVTVEHWAVVDTVALRDLTNAVGGVDVCLTNAVSDTYSGADFRAGKQTLNGDAALAFVRQRHGLRNGDLDRIARLQVFLQSLLAKLDGKHLPTLLTAVQDHVQIDQGLDVVGFIQDLAAGKAVHVGTIPVKNLDYRTPEGPFAIEVDPGQVKQFVADLPNTQGSGTNTGVPCVN